MEIEIKKEDDNIILGFDIKGITLEIEVNPKELITYLGNLLRK